MNPQTKETLKSIGLVFLCGLLALPGMSAGLIFGAFGVPGVGGWFAAIWLLAMLLLSWIPGLLFVAGIIYSFMQSQRRFVPRIAFSVLLIPYITIAVVIALMHVL